MPSDIKCPKCGSDTKIYKVSRRGGSYYYVHGCVQPSCDGKVKMSWKEQQALDKNIQHRKAKANVGTNQTYTRANRQAQSSNASPKCDEYYPQYLIDRWCPRCGQRMCWGRTGKGLFPSKHFWAVCVNRNCQYSQEISKEEIDQSKKAEANRAADKVVSKNDDFNRFLIPFGIIVMVAIILFGGYEAGWFDDLFNSGGGGGGGYGSSCTTSAGEAGLIGANGGCKYCSEGFPSTQCGGSTCSNSIDGICCCSSGGGGGGGGDGGTSIGCQHCKPGDCYIKGRCCPNYAKYPCGGSCYRTSGEAYAAGCHDTQWTWYCCNQ